MLPNARLLAVFAMITLASTGSAFAQDSSTSEALKALDKALEKPAPASKQSSAPVSKGGGIELFFLPGIYLGMTCEQAEARVGSFTKGSCGECKKNNKCDPAAKILVENLEFHCFFEFDNSGGLKRLTLSKGFKYEKNDSGTYKALESFNTFKDKISKKYGRPSPVENKKDMKVLSWGVGDHALFLVTDVSEDVSIVYVK